MTPYDVTLARSARRELDGLDRSLQSRVLLRIAALGSNPRPSGCRKLVGAEDLWRIRVGDYRVIYSIDDSRRIVDVNMIRHRSDVYR